MIRSILGKYKRALRQSITDRIWDYLMQPQPGRKGRTPFGAEELKLVRQALQSQHLCCIDGRMVPALEREFAIAYDVPYGVASTSGTAAIHVALGALDLNPGSEIITAPITDLGTVIPILSQNCIPVFADIDHTFNMDPEDVERKITPQTKAILIVHLFGNPCDMDAMVDIAKRHGLPLIEDCSQAHMTEYKGRYVGTIGDIGCFSFQQSKHMTTGDGGMTITANRSYYERMKLFADKGYARKGYGSRAYLFHAPNYRMTELVGAVGLAQLKKVRAVVDKRHELGEFMSKALSSIPGVTPAPCTPGGHHSYWMYPIGVHGVDINRLAEDLRANKVYTLPGYTGKPIYLCSESLTAKKTYGDSQWPFTGPWVAKNYEYNEGLCPRAEKDLGELLVLPWDESWTKEDVERVVGVLGNTLKNLTTGRPARSISQVPRETAEVASISHGKKLRVGIVGCGQMGRWHFDAYKKNPQVEIVAFADTNLESAERFAAEANAKAYSSTKDMIVNERLDGVSVCTLPSTHRDIALDLLEAGVHVLCEKPLAISVEQAKEMTAKAAQKNLLLLTAFKFRYFDEVQKAKEILSSGGLGKIASFRLMFGGYIDMAGTWFAQKHLSGGGILMDNGPHAIDLIRYLFGEITAVSAAVSNLQDIPVEDTGRLNFTLANGVTGTAEMSWSLPIPSKTYLEIYGENGAALLDFEGISYKFKTWDEWKRIPNGLDVKGAFARQTDHFITSIITKNPSIVCREDGEKSQVVIRAAYESSREGKTIRVS
jgi:dTDP-4-amino-4,6-dideoxygalactose transaminase/predicted dehydrogenase